MQAGVKQAGVMQTGLWPGITLSTKVRMGEPFGTRIS